MYMYSRVLCAIFRVIAHPPGFVLQPCSMPGFAHIHPFVPDEQVSGYVEMLRELEQDLCEITGYDSISFQSNRSGYDSCVRVQNAFEESHVYCIWQACLD